MKGYYHYRRLFGVSIGLILLVALTIHLEQLVKFDNVSLGLLVAVAAALTFAWSEALGIKISNVTAGPFKFEFLEVAKDAAYCIPPEQQGQFAEILNENAALFPAIGARVLWVDDHPEERVAHRQVLRRLGIQVIVATSTKEAMQTLEQDPDFTLLIRDSCREDSNEDAKDLVEWVKSKGRNLPAPLVVYSFDAFDDSVGVPQQDWITRDFSLLLARLGRELRIWRIRFPPIPQGKSPK